MTLKSLNFSLLVVTIESDDLSVLADELNKKRLMAPGFFQYAAVVVDIKQENAQLNFAQIKTIIADHEFILAGISGELSEAQKQDLHTQKIAILRSAKKQLAKEVIVEDKVAEEEKQTTNVVAIKKRKTKLIKGRVRSGQEIHAQDCDLVITGDVSPGSVVVADGSIHIHGALRGRAIAGANGDAASSIFCQTLSAELISVGGVYKLNDALPADYIGTSCAVSLHDEKMVFESLS